MGSWSNLMHNTPTPNWLRPCAGVLHKARMCGKYGSKGNSIKPVKYLTFSSATQQPPKWLLSLAAAECTKCSMESKFCHDLLLSECPQHDPGRDGSSSNNTWWHIVFSPMLIFITMFVALASGLGLGSFFLSICFPAEVHAIWKLYVLVIYSKANVNVGIFVFYI